MAVKLIKILYLVLVLNAATLAQTGSTPSQADSSSYEEWIRQFRQQSSPSKIRSSKDAKKEGEPFLMLSVVRDAPETVDPFRNGAGQIELGHQRVLPQNCAIFNTGKASCWLWSGSSIHGTDNFLTSATLSELQRFAANLPGDGYRLPPSGRRLLVQSVRSDRTEVRVYDLANLPDEVSDAIRLSKTEIHPWLLRLEPDKQLFPNQYPGETAVHQTISPDGSIALVQGQFEVGIMNRATLKVVRELREPEVGRRIIRLSNPYFTPDGQYLLLRSTLPALRVFDTKTWNRVGSLPWLPPGAVAFFPSKDWTRAVYGSDVGDVGLWDLKQKRLIAKLTSDSEISDVQYSPDSSLIAVASRPRGRVSLDFHVGIWKEDGSHVSDFRPGEEIQSPGESLFSGDDTGTLVWSRDGAHLFTICRIAGEYQIALWNVSTGRSKIVLAGCSSEIHRFMLNEGLVVVDCYQTAALQWDEDAVVRKAAQFEESLAKSP